MMLQELYEKAYTHPAYHHISPGEQLYPVFKQMVRKRGKLLDIGCGTARISNQMKADGWSYFGVDFVDARTVNARFLRRDITTDKLPSADMGYCCDVMEHIEPEKIDQTLSNILSACERCFFSISFVQDVLGHAITGDHLHLTVQPFEWWVPKLNEHGRVIQARDLLNMGAFLVGHRRPRAT